MHRASLGELARELSAKRLSAVELTRAFLARIERHDPRLNAFITIDAEKSLAQARAADARIAGGVGGPLSGFPIALMDLFCARGWR
jgi:aspartyl-tRNA(Asn)/glutamyl-tRNA(Gln) amidotransferase subunit A